MKNTPIVSVMLMICAIAFGFQSAYASFHKKVKDPDSKTIEAVHKAFPQAKKITWTEDGEDFIARFNSGSRKITALFGKRGELLHTLIYNDAKQIPFEMQVNLVKTYPDYIVQCMKEYISRESHVYYFILKNQKSNLVRWLNLKSDGHGNFIVLQKIHETV